MPSIDTLVDDINGLFQSRDTTPDAVQEARMVQFGANMATQFNRSMKERTGQRKPKVIWASELGKACVRQVWYQHYAPELGADLSGKAHFKFFYGDLLEETVLTLAEEAGHDVESRQAPRITELADGWKISGRIDAVIDGVMVDVKTASPYSFKKFEQGLDDSNDAFGYRQQLSYYNGLSVKNYDRQGFLAIEKVNGSIKFFEQDWASGEEKVDAVVRALRNTAEPPRMAGAEVDATHGNKKLCVTCSYCPFKAACFRDNNKGTGLLGVYYSYGPVFLSTVAKVPPKLTSFKEKIPAVVDDVLTMAKIRVETNMKGDE